MKTFVIPGRPESFSRLVSELRRLDFAVASLVIDQGKTIVNLKDEDEKDPTGVVTAVIQNKPVVEENKRPEPGKPPEPPPEKPEAGPNQISIDHVARKLFE